MLHNSNIFVTGGAGTLGRAIAQRRKKNGWTGKFTVYSTDTHKHESMRRIYPDINFVQGDIRNPETLFNAMVGHDVVLHLAAVKVIPASEMYSMDTNDVNVNGSINVCVQAGATGIKHVLGISTDKAAHPANAYGATKLTMEKIFQEYARVGFETKYHLVRYGNVLESTGSVLEVWKDALGRGDPITVTDPYMTRFWISPQQAVDFVIHSLELDSGMILIPKMKSLSIARLIEYTLGNVKKEMISSIPLRAGEKLHETLLTVEECMYADETQDYFFLHPTTSPMVKLPVFAPYSSDIAPELSMDEFSRLLRNE